MLNYKTYNTNPKEWLVLIHGISGDISVWDNHINDLKKEYNLLLIDLPFHGNSHTDDNLTPEMLNEKIKVILDKENIKKANFMGLSLGTLVVSQFAIKYPEYINKLVFIGSVIEVIAFFRFVVAVAVPLRYILPYKLVYNIALALLVPKSKTKINSNFYRQNFKKMGRKKLIQWIKYLSVILDGNHTINKIKENKKETLFISGELDRLFINGSRKSAKKLGSEFCVMNGCTHICHPDDTKLFNEKVINFLAKN